MVLRQKRRSSAAEAMPLWNSTRNSSLRTTGTPLTVLWRRLSRSATGAPLPCGPGDTAAWWIICSQQTGRIPIRSSPQDIPAAARWRCALQFTTSASRCAHPTAPAAAGRAASAFWADATAKALGCAKRPAASMTCWDTGGRTPLENSVRGKSAIRVPISRWPKIRWSLWRTFLWTNWEHCKTRTACPLICTSQRR